MIIQSFEKLDEIPFDSDRKMMSVIGKREGKIIAFIKGAPDVLMRNASHVLLNGEVKPIATMKDKIENQNEDFAKNALRVLGIAYKELNEGYDIDKVEKDYRSGINNYTSKVRDYYYKLQNILLYFPVEINLFFWDSSKGPHLPK